MSPKRYTAEGSVDLSKVNGASLPSEVLFSHAYRSGVGKVKQKWGVMASGLEAVGTFKLYVKWKRE